MNKGIVSIAVDRGMAQASGVRGRTCRGVDKPSRWASGAVCSSAADSSYLHCSETAKDSKLNHLRLPQAQNQGILTQTSQQTVKTRPWLAHLPLLHSAGGVDTLEAWTPVDTPAHHVRAVHPGRDARGSKRCQSRPRSWLLPPACGQNGCRQRPGRATRHQDLRGGLAGQNCLTTTHCCQAVAFCA